MFDLIEEWKPIEGYEGRYEVSNTGKVRSLNFKRAVGEVEEMRLQDKGKGYLAVWLWYGEGRNSHYVRRLVAKAFIPNPQKLLEVNHLDEDKSNNHISNLEWCNRAYNNSFGTRVKRISMSVEAFDPVSGRIIHTFPSTAEAHRNGFNSGAISKCCAGKRNTHKGLYWRYI